MVTISDIEFESTTEPVNDSGWHAQCYFSNTLNVEHLINELFN